jgi:alpha-methylacyl-CoA racemase
MFHQLKINEPLIDCLGNGKRSIALNLKSNDGVKIFEKLCQHSDVVLDPYRPGNFI